MKTKIENIMILTIDQDQHLYENSCIVFEGDTILSINDQNFEADQTIDGKGSICLPGMINTHCHLSMIPFRSLQDDCPDRLRKFLFPLESATMNETLARASVRYGAAELLLGGVTTVFDMYYFVEAIAEECVNMNLRAVIAETVLNFATCDCEVPYGGLQIAESFIQKWQGHPLITPAIAPHATNTNSAEMLQAANEISKKYDVLLSMHTSEMDYEMDYFRKEYEKTPIEYLESIGLLCDRFLAAHCIHATQHDLELFEQYGCKVAHCIGSNTKAGKGIAPIKDMIEHHIPVGLGSDGASSGNTLDLFAQMAMVAKLQKTKYHDRSLFPAVDVLALATLGGAKALRLDDQIGSLEVGKKADLILIETLSVNMFPLHDPYSAIVYSANASNVESVWVNGKQVVKNKKLVGQDLSQLRFDLQKCMAEFTAQATKLTKEMLDQNN